MAIFDTEVEILMTPAERTLLAKYVLKSSGNIVELGTFAGGSASIIARLKGDRSLTCVDNFSGRRHNYREVKQYLSQFDNLKLIPLSTQEVNWDSDIGLLLIDACHHYDWVKRDFEKWSKYVINGYVLFHDSFRPPSQHNNKVTYQPQYVDGVKQFLDELIAARKWHIVDTAETLTVFQRT